LPVDQRAHPDLAERRRYIEKLEDALAALPGATHVAATTSMPLSQRAGRDFEIEGRPPANRADFRSAHDYAVSPAFFALFDISLVGGRRFTIDDRADHPPVAII